MTYRYALLISYDGTDFHGWQKQKKVPTVQEKIEKALSIVLRQPISIIGSSRTDTGVHALGQVAHFDLVEPIRNRKSLLLSLRGLLPRSITISAIEEVPSSFHARFSAVRKKYHYFINSAFLQDPFSRHFSYKAKRKLNLERMLEGASYFLGEHDFTAFANDSTQGAAKNKPIKTIYRLDIIEKEEGYLCLFEADGFLYKMVRNIMGTLLAYEEGKVQNITELLESRDRKKIPAPAPAHALFLMKITYPKEFSLFQAHQKKEHESLTDPEWHPSEDSSMDKSTPVLQKFP